MKPLVKLITAAVLPALALGCATAKYVDHNGRDSIVNVGQINTQDWIRVADELTQSLLLSGAIQSVAGKPKVLMIGGAQIPAPVKFPVLYLQINNVNAYHLLPPASEPPDYDPDEPNRKMVPTTAMVGHFRFDGLTRMAAFSAADNYLAAAKAAFIPIYDSQMTCPLFPSIKGMKTPMVLLRQHRAMFAMANE